MSIVRRALKGICAAARVLPRGLQGPQAHLGQFVEPVARSDRSHSSRSSRRVLAAGSAVVRGHRFTVAWTCAGRRADIIRTSLSATQMDAPECVRNYKSLAQVERMFRSLKTVDLKVRPIHHRKPDRVRAHIFLCMLAYYVEWHMHEAWRELMFADTDQAAKATRDPVAPAKRSKAAQAKAASHTLDDGTPAHSFSTLLADLAGIVRNTCRTPQAGPRRADLPGRHYPNRQAAPGVRAAQANPNVGSPRNPDLTPTPRHARTNSLGGCRNFGLEPSPDGPAIRPAGWPAGRPSGCGPRSERAGDSRPAS